MVEFIFQSIALELLGECSGWLVDLLLNCSGTALELQLMSGGVGDSCSSQLHSNCSDADLIKSDFSSSG